MENVKTDDLVLEVNDLRTYFDTDEGLLKAVDGVSFQIRKNRVLGIVGESGCGKSVTAQSILRIVPHPGRMVSGQILLHDDDGTHDLVAMKAGGRELREIQGRDVAMIFQEPMTAFSPIHSIGNQIMESILIHEDVSKKNARDRTIELLRQVHIPEPERRINQLPHELSGGMRQRAMIAMAMALRPKLLIADEPTTALDVTIQAQVLRLMRDLQGEMGMSIMFITHNLGVIANMADDVAVMYLGKIVEYGSVHQIFHAPEHPYTKALLKSIPVAGREAKARLEAIGGTVPVPLELPDACGYGPRCDEFIAGVCDAQWPREVDVGDGHLARCVLHYSSEEREQIRAAHTVVEEPVT